MSREENLGFGFDDEKGVRGGVAAGVELLDGIVEGGSERGKDYGAILAADEVETGFLLNELELGWHLVDVLEHVDAFKRLRPGLPV